MLKRKLCEARLHPELTCEGPLLIRDERYANYKEGKKKKDGFPDCVFMSRINDSDRYGKLPNCY